MRLIIDYDEVRARMNTRGSLHTPSGSAWGRSVSGRGVAAADDDDDYHDHDHDHDYDYDDDDDDDGDGDCGRTLCGRPRRR